MRKDVTSPLVLWPALASIAVSTLFWISETESVSWKHLSKQIAIVWDSIRTPNDSVQPYQWDQLPEADESLLLADLPNSPLVDTSECVIDLDFPRKAKSLVDDKQPSLLRLDLPTIDDGTPSIGWEHAMHVAGMPGKSFESLLAGVRSENVQSFVQQVQRYREQGDWNNVDRIAFLPVELSQRALAGVDRTQMRDLGNAALEEILDSTGYRTAQDFGIPEFSVKHSVASATDFASKALRRSRIAQWIASAAEQIDLDEKAVPAVPLIVENHGNESELQIQPIDDLARATQLIDKILSRPPAVPLTLELEEILETEGTVIPKSIQNLGDIQLLPAEKPDVEQPAVAVKTPVETKQKLIVPTLEMSPVAWPQTPALDRQLQELAEAEVAGLAEQDWAVQVRDRLRQLHSLDRLGNERAEIILNELVTLAADGLSLGETIESRSQQIRCLSTAYALQRRLAIWVPVYQLASTSAFAEATNAKFADSQSVTTLINQVREDLQLTGDPVQWAEFLLLDDLKNALNSSDDAERSRAAIRFLTRTQWQGLDSVQSSWMNRDSVQELAFAVRQWIVQAVNYATLLEQLENLEDDSLFIRTGKIVETYQSLRFSSNAIANRIAFAIDQHYRNSNLRGTASEELVRRLVPDVEPTTMPVRTRMFGSRVRGVSRVETQLSVDFVPAENRLAWNLHSTGSVQTQSVGRKGPTAISTLGSSDFTAVTPISISSDGYQLGQSNLNVQGSTRLRNVHTNFDKIPLFGHLARNAAQSHYLNRSGTASRIANQRISNSLSEQIDQQVRERLDQRSGELSDFVFAPLSRLELNPIVTDLRTTEDRIITRYRLASDWQFAAYTPRPRAPKDSLISMQVHQSAINNALEKLVPYNETKAIHAILGDAFAVFGQQDTELPEDLPEDVAVKFATIQPITFKIENGSAWLTLRVAKLTRGDRLKLTRFIVRAEYRPQVDGHSAVLAREGHLRISGPGMSMRQRLPLRAIFNKVLSPTRTLPLIAESMLADQPATNDLDISQIELRDGWIALALSAQKASTMVTGQG